MMSAGGQAWNILFFSSMKYSLYNVDIMYCFHNCWRSILSTIYKIYGFFLDLFSKLAAILDFQTVVLNEDYVHRARRFIHLLVSQSEDVIDYMHY